MIKTKNILSSKIIELCEHMPYPIMIVDNSMEPCYINHCYTKNFGFEIEDISGDNDYSDIVYPDDDYRQMINIYWEKYLETRNGFSDIFNQKDKDNMLHKVKVKLISINQNYTLFCFDDITEFNKILENFTITNSRYSTISEVSLEGVLIISHGKIIEANSAACNMFNMNYHDLIGIDEIALYTKGSHEKIIKQMLFCDESLIEVTGVRSDKTEFPLEIYVRSVEVDIHNYQVSLLRDMTRIEKLKMRLKQEEAILSTMIDSAHDQIYIKDTNNEIINYNRSFATFWDNIVDVFNEEEDLFVLINKQKIRRKHYVEKNGMKFHFDIVKTPFFDSADNLLGLVSITRDVTDIFTSQQEALNAFKVREEFLNNISHEIRTPLNGLMGMIQLLELSKLNEEQEEFISIMKESSEELLNKFEDLIKVTQLKSGQIEVSSDRFNINIVLSRVLETVMLQAKIKGVEFKSIIDATIPENLIGDFEKIVEIVHKILDNSVKFTLEGSILFSISLIDETDNTVILSFNIIDTGIGMDDEMFKNALMSVTQLDESMTKEYSGLGNGLSIANDLLKLLDSRLKLQSGLTKGTSFGFEITFKK